MEKTHWLQSPNKNYLGHWDLPRDKDQVLTIQSANWEEVKNPINHTKEAKRVIRFQEKEFKPMICNQTNAQAILNSTGINFMEDSIGQKIQLYVGEHKDRRTGEFVDCVRVRHKFTGGNDKLLAEATELFSKLHQTLTQKQFDSAKVIIENKQATEYERLIKFLKTK